ncbi:MAG TPA: periplasmic heavy metal sensor [Burkholderiales bacterium]|nr:periplasmic heavy metal sensor [Burkholderiales bacterium]
MKRNWLGIALAASLALNAGVIAAAGYKAWSGARTDGYFGMPHERLPEHLDLTAEQRRRWHAMEEGFLAEFSADARQIAAHREKMVRLIFGERPDATAIEAERAAIFALQDRQQRRIVAQLAKEAALLTPEQRAKLAEQLLRQGPPRGAVPGR